MNKILFLLLLIPYLSFTQETGGDIVGKTSRTELQNDSLFGPVFHVEYINYKANNEVLTELKAFIYSYQITIVLATWCGDSKEQVPRFINILDRLDYNTRKVNFICVDHSKQAPDTEVEKLNIQRVPTFIVYDQNGNEIGRIIETPKATLEEDLLHIIKSHLALL